MDYYCKLTNDKQEFYQNFSVMFEYKPCYLTGNADYLHLSPKTKHIQKVNRGYCGHENDTEVTEKELVELIVSGKAPEVKYYSYDELKVGDVFQYKNENIHYRKLDSQYTYQHIVQHAHNNRFLMLIDDCAILSGKFLKKVKNV